jgi:hypothetical protein
MSPPTANFTDQVPPLSRRGLLIACWAAMTGVARASDRPRTASADQVLIEWGTAPAGSSSQQTRLKVLGSGLFESWPAGRSVSHREQRTPDEARQLASKLAELIREADVGTDSIQRELREQSRRTGLSFAIQHADDSLIRIVTDTGLIQVRCPASLLLAERFPDAARLQAFVRIERRISNLACVVQCGGKQAAETVCAKANERLRADHPGTTPWTIEDLMMVRTSSDGGRFLQFCRGEAGSETWTTCVTETPGGTSRVTVIPPASLVR